MCRLKARYPRTKAFWASKKPFFEICEEEVAEGTHTSYWIAFATIQCDIEVIDFDLKSQRSLQRHFPGLVICVRTRLFELLLFMIQARTPQKPFDLFLKDPSSYAGNA
ncbi:hypothetical protein QYF36_026365 [Acer negundo]|nr:hypothetical protein QYF36_026365 [Acer negundo]